MFMFSELAKEFISLLLQLEAGSRMSAKAALAHNWLRQAHSDNNQHATNNQHALNKNQHAHPWQRQGTQHALEKHQHANLDNQHPTNHHAHPWHALADNQRDTWNKNQRAMKKNQHARNHRESQDYENWFQEEKHLERVSDWPSSSSSSPPETISVDDHQLELDHLSEPEHRLDQSCSKTKPFPGLQYLQDKWTAFKKDFHQGFWAKAKCKNTFSVKHISSGFPCKKKIAKVCFV